ncbi:Synaptobrevin [Arabidopsis suecica]|uniref:Synaptobrevin n=2 Tax=Arabidopsis TaxID=3701 RepID=A0A8T2B865_ARASU|nr:Synaptobrevin [Arabidopsis suecica]
MQYCVDLPEEISKLAKVKAQVTDVKCVIMENIEKGLDCSEKIELLVDKIREPLLTSTRFQRVRNENDKKDVVSEHED